MGLQFRKLRSRLSASWSVVKNKLTTAAQPPASGLQQKGQQHEAVQDRESVDGQSDLQWSESRRTYSEPVGVICRTSVASRDSATSSLGLASHECELEEYDDVFLAPESWKESVSWEVQKGLALEEIGANSEVVRFSTGVPEDWVVPANELTVGPILTAGERETMHRGYWHGSVYIRTRTPMGAGDFGYFLDEVATLSSIRHENIQLFMGVCLDMDGGTLAIIMSELKGETLSTRLHNFGHNFTTPSKMKILKQIAEGMEYLHAKGIPHGSLSTRCVHLHSRVCISIRPQVETSRQVKRVDLSSLAPECMRHLYHEDLGRQMVLDGRPTFPEDIFAFGTMVYELQTLQRPLQSLPIEAVIWQVGRGDCQPLTLLPKGLLRTIISRCWAEPPPSRPSFKDLLITLEKNVVFSSTTRLKPSLSLPSIPSELCNYI